MKISLLVLILKMVTGDLPSLSLSCVDWEGFFWLKADWSKSQESGKMYSVNGAELKAN